MTVRTRRAVVLDRILNNQVGPDLAAVVHAYDRRTLKEVTSQDCCRRSARSLAEEPDSYWSWADFLERSKAYQYTERSGLPCDWGWFDVDHPAYEKQVPHKNEGWCWLYFLDIMANMAFGSTRSHQQNLSLP